METHFVPRFKNLYPWTSSDPQTRPMHSLNEETSFPTKRSGRVQILMNPEVSAVFGQKSLSFSLPKSLPLKSLPTVLLHIFHCETWLQVPVKEMPANSGGVTWTLRSCQSISLSQFLGKEAENHDS